MIHPRVGGGPALAEVLALGEPAARGLVEGIRRGGVSGEGVAVGVGSGPLVLPGLSAVRAPHHPSQLYARHDEVRVLVGECDRPDVGGPGPGRKAPRRRRREVLQALQLPPGRAAVAADEQGARLRPGVERPVDGRDGDRGDPGMLDAREPLPALAAVLALEQALVRGADVYSVWRLGIDGETSGAAVLQRQLDVAVLYDRHGAIRGRVKPDHSRAAFLDTSYIHLAAVGVCARVPS